MTIDIEPGLTGQVRHLVKTWGDDTIIETAGALTTSEADALARVFAAEQGVRGGLFVMIAHLRASIDGAQLVGDHEADAAAVDDHGWLADAELWDQIADGWALSHAEARSLADRGHAAAAAS